MNKPLKIVSIGPYLPFRGGISDFNKDLIKQLKISNDVEIVNFKKLYPNFLFPGKSQIINDDLNNSYDSRRILNPLNISFVCNSTGNTYKEIITGNKGRSVSKIGNVS